MKTHTQKTHCVLVVNLHSNIVFYYFYNTCVIHKDHTIRIVK